MLLVDLRQERDYAHRLQTLVALGLPLRALKRFLDELV